MLALPVLFVWLLLRRGYARSTRRAAFGYTLTLPCLMMTAMIVQGLRG